MNNKNYKKLLDDRAKNIPKSVFTKNLVNEYSIIQNVPEDNRVINSQNDLLIKLDEPINIVNKYNAVLDDRQKEENQRSIDINKYRNILEEKYKNILEEKYENILDQKYKNILDEQKRKTRELMERLNKK